MERQRYDPHHAQPMEDLSHVFFTAENRAHARSRHADPSIHRTILEDCALDPFLARLFEQAGMDASRYRPNVLQHRLPAALRRVGVRSTHDAVEKLEKDPGLVGAALDSVLIGVTGFFRDAEVWDFLAAALPSLLRTRRRIRALSAGCSGGQELYSLAILLDEQDVLDESLLLGVDLRVQAIARAESGVIDKADADALEAAGRSRYIQNEDVPRVAPRLRRAVQWRLDDIHRLSEGPSWDIILFRNLAIYLRCPAPLWERYSRQLSPGGMLVTGKAETPPRTLPLCREARCLYRKAAG